ncbi:hypothetical protein EDD86DRAFT_113104 [Gorgonomyces haynaldii]|nr:hypothetical protein EDD86DRAFT_113104 [Gorgonomyces haynaldii]
MLLSLLIGVAAQGQQCSATISCPKGLLCNFTDGAKQTGVCFNPTNGPLPTTNTTACQSISDCTLGQICTNNVCQNPGEAVSTWFTTTVFHLTVEYHHRCSSLPSSDFVQLMSHLLLLQMLLLCCTHRCQGNQGCGQGRICDRESGSQGWNT